MNSLSKSLVLPLIFGLVTPILGCKPKDPKPRKAKAGTKIAQPWPAQLGKAFPDLKLRNLEGKDIALSSFKGKFLIFHLAGIQSPASTTIVGGDNWPPKKGSKKTEGFPSLNQLLAGYGLEDNKDVIVIHGLLLDDQYDPPTLARAKEWSKRFGLARSNVITLVGNKRHVKNDVALSRSGTLYFVDKDFILRWESGIPSSPHNLYTESLPNFDEKVAPKYDDFDIAETKRSRSLEKKFWKPLREKDWNAVEGFLTATRGKRAGPGFIVDPFNQFMDYLNREIYWPGQFNEWCKARPKSAMAFLIRGRAGIDYAWAARGSGFANTVSNSAFQTFHERLLNAKADLEKAQSLDSDCVHATAALITVHMGLSRGRPNFQLLQKVVNKRPLLLNAYVRCLSASFPKWGGSWEEAARVIAFAKQNMKNDKRWKSLVFDFHMERAYRSPNPAAYLNKKEVRTELTQTYEDLALAFPKSLIPVDQAMRWAATARLQTRMVKMRSKLAEMGHVGRIHQLSRFYAKGTDGYPEDHYKAFALIRKAAGIGGMKGASDMAYYYRGGSKLVKPNEKLAFAWFRRSALLGSDWASKQIIDHYAKIKKLTKGQLKDLTRVARWNYHRNRKGARELLNQCLRKAPELRQEADPAVPK